MSRNDMSRFSYTAPTANIGRSTFNMHHDVKFTGNAGQLIPFDAIEVLPGDTFQMNPSILCRMMTPIYATMDNAYLDTYAFFVPYRLVWENWEKFNGEAEPSEWYDPVERIVPQLDPSLASSFSMTAEEYFGSVYDYLGFPFYNVDQVVDPDYVLKPTDIVIVANGHVLHHRAYRLIYNEWFRDQNLQDSLLINYGDFEAQNGLVELGRVMNVAKYQDYFTTALPQPQKGDAVSIGLWDDVPVYAGLRHDTDFAGQEMLFNSNLPLEGGDSNAIPFYHLGLRNVRGFGSATNVGSTTIDRNPETIDIDSLPFYAHPSNLWARTSSVPAVTVNELRLAFQLQRILELSARSGSRYTEILRSFFGVVSPDSRLQRPEYLGGKRIPLNLSQVVQQSSSVDQSPLGQIGGYSKTVDNFRGFNKSFTEAGVIIWLAAVRYDHSYQQGLHRQYSRKTKFDFYWPQLAHIGEQGIRNKEIYFGSDGKNEEIFGYQEAWAEYRHIQNRVGGSFRSGALGGSLDAWHYADDYHSRPFLSDDWIQETPVNVDRTLAVSSSVSHQFMFDIYMDTLATRPLPVYSIPGLIDHY